MGKLEIARQGLAGRPLVDIGRIAFVILLLCVLFATEARSQNTTALTQNPVTTSGGTATVTTTTAPIQTTSTASGSETTITPPPPAVSTAMVNDTTATATVVSGTTNTATVVSTPAADVTTTTTEASGPASSPPAVPTATTTTTTQSPGGNTDDGTTTTTTAASSSSSDSASSTTTTDMTTMSSTTTESTPPPSGTVNVTTPVANGTTAPPGPPPTPIVAAEMAPTVITAMRSTAAVVSLLAAPVNPSLCPHAARVSLIIDQSRCAYNIDLNQMEVVFYPIQVGFADEKTGKFLAAAIILWPFAVVFLAGHYILVMVRSSAPSGSSEHEQAMLRDLAMQRYKFPSLTVSTMTLFFWQPLIMSSVAVLVHGVNQWARLVAFGTMIFACAFASFVVRWFYTRRQLVEFVPYNRFYFRRHAFNSLVLKGGDVTKLLGILTLPPVVEGDDDDDGKKKKKDKKKNKGKKGKDKKAKGKKAKKGKTKKNKRRDSDEESDEDGSSSAASSSAVGASSSSSDDSESSDGGAKKRGKKNKKKLARDGGETAEPIGAAGRKKKNKKKGQQDEEAAQLAGATEVDIPMVPLSKPMKEKATQLLMRDWQEGLADDASTLDEQAKLRRGVAVLPTIPRFAGGSKNPKKKKKKQNASDSDDDSDSSESSGSGDDAARAEPLSLRDIPRWMRRAPWLATMSVPFARFFVGEGRWADVPGRYGFSSKNGFMFQHYADRRHWFMLVELTFCTAFGVLEGIKPMTKEGCWRVATSNFALLVLYVLLVAALRPFLSLWDNATFALVALQQATSCALLLAAGEDMTQDVRRSGEIYAFACLSVVTMKGLLDFGGMLKLNAHKRHTWAVMHGQEAPKTSSAARRRSKAADSASDDGDGVIAEEMKSPAAAAAAGRGGARKQGKSGRSPLGDAAQPLLQVPARAPANPLAATTASPRKARPAVAKEDEEIDIDF